MSKLKKYFYILFPLLIGGIVSLLLINKIDYSNLSKPPLAPPKILFPIMWSIIYFLMGLSFYYFKRNYGKDDKTEFIYYLQLGINALWTIIFFVFKLRFLAIIWIILLLITIIILYLRYLKQNKISAYLLIPYILWTSFATYLTIGIYLLNK